MNAMLMRRRKEGTNKRFEYKLRLGKGLFASPSSLFLFFSVKLRTVGTIIHFNLFDKNIFKIGFLAPFFSELV